MRPKHVDYDVPVRGLQRYEWRGYDPTTHADARFTTFKQHPQAIDQKYLITWNNKQAQGLPRHRRQRLLERLPLDQPRGPAQADDPRQAQDRPREADRRDGDGRLDGPARACRPAAGAEADRPAQGHGAAAGGARAARVAEGRRAAPRPEPRRRLRALRRRADHGRVVAALDLARSSGRGSARPRSRGSSAPSPIDNPPNGHGGASRLVLPGPVVRLRPQGPAHAAWARKVKGRYGKRLLRQGQPEALPHGARGAR